MPKKPKHKPVTPYMLIIAISPDGKHYDKDDRIMKGATLDEAKIKAERLLNTNKYSYIKILNELNQELWKARTKQN